MLYGNTSIITPRDNPVQYDAAWRAAFAAAVLDYPDARIEAEFLPYKRDPWIQRQVEYLRSVRGNRPLTKDQKALRIASTWFQGNRPSDVKFKLEPLLLTAVGFDIISLDIGGGEVDDDVFKAYERLFFNVRKDDGTMHPSCQLRTYFSLPDGQLGPGTPDEVIWRVVAANSGYDALVSMWLWNDAHGLLQTDPGYMLRETWRAAQAQMHHDIIGRRVGHMHMTMLMDKITAHERMRHECGGSVDQETEMLKVALNLLSLTQPHMVSSAKTVDEAAQITAAVQNKLLAESAVAKTAVADAGVAIGKDAFNEKLQAQLGLPKNGSKE